MDVVYTALIGRYEELNEETPRAHPGAHYVCYTDDESLRSDCWEVRRVRPVLPWDPTRSARALKIQVPDEVWDGADRSLWLDNRVTLKVAPQRLLDAWLPDGGSDVALPMHSFRETVSDEFEAVLRSGYDEPKRVRGLRADIVRSGGGDVLLERPYWTAVLARRHTAEVREVMRQWAAIVMATSRRDQLSVNYAFRHLAPGRVVGHELDNIQSDLHVWRRLRKRYDVLFQSDLRYTLRQHALDDARRRRAARREPRL